MSYSSSVSSSSTDSSTTKWQDKLQERCRDAQLNPPKFNIFSDRRGGRTAWSASVEISGKTIPARLWYDGQYLHNAREDAAEVAVKLFQHQSFGYSRR